MRGMDKKKLPCSHLVTWCTLMRQRRFGAGGDVITFCAWPQSMRGMDKKKRRLAGVQAVVIAPTRELAMQLTKVLTEITENSSLRS